MTHNDWQFRILLQSDLTFHIYNDQKQIQHFFLTMVFYLWTKDEEFSFIYLAKYEQIKIHEITFTNKKWVSQMNKIV